jgi:hypothetical protein
MRAARLKRLGIVDHEALRQRLRGALPVPHPVTPETKRAKGEREGGIT